MKTHLLIVSLIAVHALHAASVPVEIPISTIPVTITQPGHYFFVADLFFSVPLPTSTVTAITVNAPGPVVIDVRGFTLNGPTRAFFPTSNYLTLYPTGILIQTSNVTVENGSVTGFWNGVSASGQSNAYLSGIKLECLTFTGSGNDGTAFSWINSSLVRNCRYVNNYAGLYDVFSATGNRFINITAVNSGNPLQAFNVGTPFNSTVAMSYTAIPALTSK